MKRKMFLTFVLTSFFACNLYADYDPSVNPLDHGIEIISIDNLLTGFSFEGEVHYDVYAPGEYTGTITDISGNVIASNDIAGLYVYEYQVTSTQGIGDNLSIAIAAGSGAANFGF